MPRPAWENLSDFLDPADFATEAAIEFAAGGIRSVIGIFDDPHLNVQLGEYEGNSSDPRFLADEAQLVGVDRGDQVTVGGKLYDVLDRPQSDGTGMATLRLAEAPQ